MVSIRRILVGVDFSSPSEEALDFAIAFARRLEANLTLLHVYQIPGFTFPETIVPAPPEVLDRIVEENRKHLEHLAERCRAAGVETKIELRPGSPASEIVQAGTEGYNLVIVGTHGRTGFRHALIGSVAEKVVRRSAVPVITVRASQHADAPAHL